MSTKEEIKKNLLTVLPYLRYALKAARAEGGPTAKVGLSVMYYEPGGAGKMMFSVDAPSFIEDIAQLLDAPAYTEEDEMNAKADEILRQFGLRKETS